MGSKMNKINEISKKLKNTPLHELLILAGTALETNATESQTDFILFHVELALEKRKLMKKMGALK